MTLRTGDAMVESRMGAVAWGLWPALRFPSPLIKPSVPISGTRLSDWLHRKALDGRPLDAGVQRCHLARDASSPCDMSFHLRARIVVGVCRLIANHLHLAVFRSMPKSQGPLLRWHYPASTLIRPCPTPAMAVAFRNVEDATLADDESPPITRTTFPTCRAHYPGGSSGCACRLLPCSCSLPQMAGGSASALSLSRPA